MRSLRLGAVLLALVLVASACGDDGDDGNGESVEGESTTTIRSVTTTVGPTVSPPTTSTTSTALPAQDEPPSPPTSSVPADAPPTVGPPPPPSNVKCLAGGEGELLLEWDALDSPSEISKIRVYVSEDGGPFITNGEFTMGQVDTTRGGGARWAAPARSVPANVPLRLTVTSFNLLGQESGWYEVPAYYTGPGQPCGVGETPTLPPPLCTAGCDEAAGEPQS